MSMSVDRTGVFRVEVVDNGLGETRKAGYPQFNINAKVLAHYDQDTEAWVDFSECGNGYTFMYVWYGRQEKRTRHYS